MLFVLFFVFFKQKTAYEMRISDWSSDVCSSDLLLVGRSSAERIKYALGEACTRGGAADTIAVKGRSLMSGLPAAIRIAPIEFADVIERHAQHIVDLILELLAETPPELSKDIHGQDRKSTRLNSSH